MRKRRITTLRNSLKRTDFPKYKSRILRSSWLARSRKLGLDPKQVPTIPQIRDWLNAQEPYTCYYTKVLLGLVFEVDHKVPVSRSGSFDLYNVCLTTPLLNGAKGSLTDKEFKQLLKVISKWDDKGLSLLQRLRRGHF